MSGNPPFAAPMIRPFRKFRIDKAHPASHANATCMAEEIARTAEKFRKACALFFNRE